MVAQALAESTGWPMAEGDDFHPPANVEKMRSGHPLTDSDRRQWLSAIADWIGASEQAGHSSVVTCSALNRSYRDLLRDGHPSVSFCQLEAVTGTLRARLQARKSHYMPASLLDSQLATLQSLEDDEPGGRVDAEGDPASVLEAVRQCVASAVAAAGRPEA